MASSHIEANALFRVDGMVAVVTGGGSGIGMVMAKALAANGAKKVYILGRRTEPLADVAKENPSVLIPVQCDVTSKASLQSAVDTITADAGYINLLVANSGILGPIKRWNPAKTISELRKELFTDFDMEEMTQTFQVNVTGAFFSMTAFLELLDAGNKHAVTGKDAFGGPAVGGSDAPMVQSQIIVTSSISAYSRMAVSAPAYASSKAAVMHLTKQASTSLCKYGIRANALAPGLFPSEMAMTLMGERKPEEEAYENPMFISARRFGGDEEMAGSLLYLASRAGAYCNGSALVMDGGRLSMIPSSY
ncbi:short chain dehydrogenase [Bombardia bombarda]|uniref:Short chain dehydrogenase n=1 Tax=Bombardia bombarda TaxID=252184 RepID=A0AA39W444_9PEZI|nr:short chain dehydrogenase [Bombardia bombarda]